MKALSLIVLAVAVIWMGGCIGVAVVADYDYSNHVQSYWDLSVKASTIQQKSEYLDKFIDALEHAGLAHSNALILETPNNSTEQNLRAVKSLQTRMHEIFGMDVNSFQYQQAIQQITAQEQDEAKDMLGEFEGAWYLQHHFFLWEWIGIIHAILVIVLLVVAVVFVWWAFDQY